MFAEGFFKTTFGFEETNYDDVQKLLLQSAEFTKSSINRSPTETDVVIPGSERCILRNLPNGTTLDCGRFSTPSVAELRQLVELELQAPGMADHVKQFIAKEAPPLISFRNVTGESFSMHCQNDLRGAVFQAASQFNYLEFPSPGVVPEKGINGYMHDRTQGPACAMACGAGTAYRNYLIDVSGPSADETSASSAAPATRGQRKDKQCDGLADATAHLLHVSRSEHSFYVVRNGYVESTGEKLDRLNAFLASEPAAGLEFSSKLRIAVQEDTQVTAPSAGKAFRKQPDGTWKEVCDEASCAASAPLVTQTYNSALSVGYSRVGDRAWEPLARLVLNGTYEATLLVGVLQTLRNIRVAGGKPGPILVPILLTKVGGGVFGNRAEWIVDAIRSGVRSVSSLGVPLDVRVVHFREIEQDYTPLEQELTTK